MTALSHSPFLYALGWAIANSLWQMALLWLAYHLFFNLRRKGKPSFRHLAGVTFLLTGFVWFTITFLSKFMEVSQIQKYLVDIPSTDEKTGSGLFAGQSGISWNLIINAIEGYLPFLSAGYLVILFSLFIRLLNALAFSNKLRTQQLVEIDEKWRHYLLRVSNQLALNKPVRIYLSGLIDVPATIGFLKPVILLPFATFNHLSVPQVEAVILHEIAHIRRYDYLVNLFIAVTETILFFNPFTQLLAASLKKEREMSCDDFVVRFQRDPQNYVAALLSLEKMRLGQSNGLALAATGEKNQLLSRVKRILNVKSRNLNYGQKLLGLLVAVGFITSLAWISPSEPVSQAQNKDQLLAQTINGLLRDTLTENKVIIVQRQSRPDSIIHLGAQRKPIQYQADKMTLHKGPSGDTILFDGNINWNHFPENLPQQLEDRAMLISPYPQSWYGEEHLLPRRMTSTPSPGEPAEEYQPFPEQEIIRLPEAPYSMEVHPGINIARLTNRELQEIRAGILEIEKQKQTIEKTRRETPRLQRTIEWQRQQERLLEQLEAARDQMAHLLEETIGGNRKVQTRNAFPPAYYYFTGMEQAAIARAPEMQKQLLSKFQMAKRSHNNPSLVRADEETSRAYSYQYQESKKMERRMAEEEKRIMNKMEIAGQEKWNALQGIAVRDSIDQAQILQLYFPVDNEVLTNINENGPLFEIVEEEGTPEAESPSNRKIKNVTRIHFQSNPGHFQVEIKTPKKQPKTGRL